MTLDPSNNRFWHGGPKGLRQIEPPTRTGAKSYGAQINSAICRRDRVYLTKSYLAATLYAASHGDGTVYLVEHRGVLEMDPDCDLPGLSFAADSAVIIKECRPTGKQLKRARKAILSGSLIMPEKPHDR